MKILASDFDGTLFIEGQISEESKAVIKKFQQAGNKFGLCTGRPLMGIEPFSEGIEYDFYILCTGGVVLNKEKEDIARHSYEVAIADEIAEKYKDKGNVMCLYNGEAYFYQTKKRFGLPSKMVSSFREIGAKEIESISILCDKEEDAKEVAYQINERYHDLCSAHQNIAAIDIVAKGCSKASGLQALQKYYQLEKEDIYVIGDSYNDIVMFEEVPHSFSFPYAPKRVQEKSESIVENIAEAMNRMLEK